MSRRRTQLRGFGRTTRLAAVFLVAAGMTIVEAPAQAAPSTKFFTSSVAPGAVDAAAPHQVFAFTLTNCGAQTAGCTKASQQSLGSANIQVDAAFAAVSADVSAPGWFVSQPVTNGLVQLRSTVASGGLAPGQSIAVSIVADTPATTGVYTWKTAVKQSNDFSGSGNDFAITANQPQVLVGFPDHLQFVTQPSSVQASTTSSTSYMCPAPSVQVVSAQGSAVTIGNAQVTLGADANFGDPSLGGTTSAASVAGLATFGTSSCNSGLTAAHLGTGYRLRGSATWTFGSYQVSLSTSQDSGPFDVVQVLTTCQAAVTCSAAGSGAHTNASVEASSAATIDQLELAIGLDSLAGTTCRPSNQPAGMEVVRVVVDHRDKTVTLTFDKYLVNLAPNNGTPLFIVCFAAPWGNWVTDRGGTPTFNSVTNEYEGILPTCGTAGLAPANPCVMSRAKKAGSEIVQVSIPFQAGRADPKLW
ncbi:MAG: hypothetical protein ABI912_09625 [Actinomycetota bacterium]